jgi:CBS domain-containing protein
VTAVTTAAQEQEQEQTRRPAQGGPEQLLGTVGETMTRAVILLSADMPAEWALRRLDRQAVSGAPVVDQSGRPLGVLTRDDVLRAVAAVSVDRRPAGSG